MQITLRNKAVELHEKVEMPDKDFLVRVFYYEQEETGGLFAQHWHEDIEFIIVLQGSITMEFSSGIIEVSAGQSIVINSNEYHGCANSQGNLSLYCIMVDMSVLNSRFIDICEEKYIQPLFQNEILFKNLVADSEQFSGYIMNITAEYTAKKDGFELAIKASLYNMLVYLLRNNVDRILTPRENLIHSTNLQRVNSVLQYINENYMDDINVVDLSQKLGISKFYFCKIFKKKTGKTVTEYLNFVRMREAVLLLLETDRSITEIAITVGFNDMNYFSRIFKAVMGKPPTDVRRTARELYQH